MEIILNTTSPDAKDLKKLLKEKNVKLTGFFLWLMENPDVVESLCNQIPNEVQYKIKKNIKHK